MNIADAFSPKPFEIEGVGPAIAPEANDALAAWMRAGLEAATWGSSEQFVRAFLATQVKPEGKDHPLGQTVVDALTAEALQRTSENFVTIVGWAFTPVLIVDEAKGATIWRHRRSNERYSVEKRDGETATDCHLRLFSDWGHDMAERPEAMSRRMDQASQSPYESSLEWFAKSATPSAKFAAMGGLASANTAAMRAALGVDRTSSLSKLMEFASPFKDLTAAGGLRDAMRLAGLVPDPSAPVRAMLESSRQAMEGVSHASEIMKLARARPQSLFAAGLLPDYARLGGIINDPSGVMKLIGDAGKWGVVMNGVLGQTSALASIQKLTASMEFYSALSRQLDLGIPASHLAALNASQAAFTGTRAVFDYGSLFKRGFQTVGALGMDGVLPPGLSSDVLRHYAEMSASTPIFSTAVSAAHLIDVDDLPVSSIGDFLSRAKATLLGLLENEKDVIQRNGLLYVLSFVVAVLALVLAWEANQKEGPEAKDVQELSAEIKALGHTVQRLNESHEDDRRQLYEIRYVHQSSPLRLAPHAHATKIRNVYPDQIIRVTGERDGWAEVEVFDYQNDRPVAGWIYRRNLRMTPLP